MDSYHSCTHNPQSCTPDCVITIASVQMEREFSDTETERSSRLQPLCSVEKLKLVSDVSCEYQGCHRDDLSVSVWGIPRCPAHSIQQFSCQVQLKSNLLNSCIFNISSNIYYFAISKYKSVILIYSVPWKNVYNCHMNIPYMYMWYVYSRIWNSCMWFSLYLLWRHSTETLSALLGIVWRNQPVTAEFA